METGRASSLANVETKFAQQNQNFNYSAFAKQKF